jgi:tRNA(Ile)-lysidine synthase TilS/MesJ
MRICSICVLPETFPTIEFDRKGICKYCRSFRGEKRQEELKKEYREKCLSLLNGQKGLHDYDVLIAYSGGKDSSYTLDVFKNYFNLRVLALSFDHGFVSPYAMKNMRTVTERLGIDHIIFKPNFEVMKKVFNISMNENPYPKKALKRASAICLSCIYLISLISLRMALEKEIPFIGYGWSPGQAQVQSSVTKSSPAFIQAIQRAIYEPMFKKIGHEKRPYLLEDKHFMLSDKFPYNIHPLAFLDYDEKKIYQRIEELGWEPPKDTDPNSTNCLMNGFANQLHQDQFGFHPYAFEIAGLVRTGVLSREEGLKRLNEPADARIIEEVKQKLGI